MENKRDISDELLAAYLEGNVNEQEVAQVLQAVRTDDELQQVLDIALQLEDAEEEQPMLQMAAEGSRNLCDVQCEAFILQRCGISCTIDELLEIAKEHHWIRRAGTPLDCIGNLMEHSGLKVTRKYRATLDDVREALVTECGVIAAVDCDKLYPERPDEEDATNHAVVVTGIQEDVATIYDPENIQEADFPLPLFLSAWNESCNYMVSVCSLK
jgi:hypothetical protein